MDVLRAEIERLYAKGALPPEVAVHARHACREVREALTRGEGRAAEKIDGQWRVNAWVKQGILLGFRLGDLEESGSGPLSFVDKDTFPARRFGKVSLRSEEHTSELQSRLHLVCRLLLEKK